LFLGLLDRLLLVSGQLTNLVPGHEVLAVDEEEEGEWVSV
jgi:hypothetical protein